MTANERKGPKQSKLATWQQLQDMGYTIRTVQTLVESNTEEEPTTVESVILTVDSVDPEPVKEELQKIVKKSKTKTDGAEG